MKLLATFITTCLLLFGLHLFGCAPALPPADPALASQLQEEALQDLFLKNFPAASEKYSRAIQYDPQNSQLYLQLAEVIEMLQNFKAAADLYDQAISRLPAGDTDLALIHYRSGLAHARDKSSLKKARRRLEKVVDPARKLDLEGFITLTDGDPARALELFSRALKETSDQNLQARIYYHASLAHYRQGNPIESKNALFHAVNNARSLALNEHIRILFDEIR